MFRKRTPQERFWEILPGLLLWTVFFGAILLSYYHPLTAALFIICFDLYWVLKSINVSVHLVASYKKFRFYFITDGYKVKFLKAEELKDLLMKFVRMSEKKDQQKTIEEIKHILRSLGEEGF